MRLFVAVWPDDAAKEALSAVVPSVVVSDLRWIAPDDWHVTIAFLGSMPDEEYADLVGALRGIGPSLAPATATMGSQIRILGAGVLYVPVDGLDNLAGPVRKATDPFNRSPDRDRPFFGHLTLARAARGRQVPAAAAGVPVASAWPVTTVGLVASVPNRQRSRYTVRETVVLGT